MNRLSYVLWFGFAFVVAVACGKDGTAPSKTADDAEGDAPPAPESAREPSPEELPGLEPDAVLTIVADYESAISGCHVVGYSGAAAHSGSVTVAWSINPDGSVRDAVIADSSFSEEAFHTCILKVIGGIRFPRAPGSTDVGGWRIRFRSRGAAPE